MKELAILVAAGCLASAAYEGIKRITPIQRKLNMTILRKSQVASEKYSLEVALVDLMNAEHNAAERFGVEA